MKTFFINIASHAGLLACVTPDAVLSAVPVDHRIRDEELLPLVSQCWSDAKWKQKDIERIACVVGPGGFMSLRVGVSLANALAWGLHVPVAGIHLSDLCVAQLKPEDQVCGPDGKSCTFLWLHSTKKEELFVRGFGEAAGQWSEPTHVKMEELRSALTLGPSPVAGEGGRWFGELIEEHRDIVAKMGWQEVHLRPEEEILPSFLGVQRYGEDTLVPWYGRGW